MSRLRRAFAISRKDVESYYAKPPLVTWGLLFPSVLILAIYLKDRSGYLHVAPGIIGMTLLFGATSMAAVSITFEKRAGTLERVLLAPIGPGTIVLGKAVSAAAFGIATSLVLAAGLAALLGMPLARPLPFAAGIILGAGIFSLLGIIASITVREVFEAMTLMNLFRFPILFVSGVFLPLDAMPDWIRPVALASPLTHIVELIRLGVHGESSLGSAWIPAGVSALFLAAACAAAGPVFRRFATR